MPKFLRAAYFTLLIALPAVLFFSYYPIISLGANASMNFELSLPLIWLVLFDLVSVANFAMIFKEHENSIICYKEEEKKKGFKNSCEGVKSGKGITRGFAVFFEDRKDLAARPGAQGREKSMQILLLFLFPIYITLSIFWSMNPLRALLTAGIIWLLFIAIFAIIRLTHLLNPPAKLKIWAIRAFFVSAALVCLFCFIQSLLDSCGLSRETTLLCAGCTYRSFGFPHPSGFAIEPQFMGNLLLAPTLLALYLLTKNSKSLSKTSQQATTNPLEPEQISKTEHIEPEQQSFTFPHLRKTPANFVLVTCAILFSTTLFFTFSRGAIYSYALGLLILIIFALRRHIFRPALIIIPVATFLLSLGLQGTFAHFGPTSETFTSAITKSIHQLSLGIIDFRTDNQSEADTGETVDTTIEDGSVASVSGANNQAGTGMAVTPSGEQPESATAPRTEATDPVFSGYVAESTNVRLGLSSTALAAWSRNPQTILFGVGLGGAGIAMHDFDPTANPSPKEIVQNQPISLLLETGLTGVILLLFALYLVFSPRGLEAPNPPVASQLSSFWTHPALPLLAALIAAYLLSMQFFAGLPNALHIYLLPPLFYYLFLPNSPKSAKISKDSINSLPKTQNKHKHS